MTKEMYDEDTGRGDFYDDDEKSPDVPNTSEFRPCPFCGNMPMKTATHTVLCETCHREVLPEVWNQRPLEDALRKQLASRDALIERLVDAGENLVFHTFGSEEPWMNSDGKNWNSLIAEYRATKTDGGAE